MGSELPITPATDWLDSASDPISQQEWEAFTRRVPGLRPQGWVDGSDLGRRPVFAWTCDDGTVVSLSWRHGQVQVAGAFSDAATDPWPGWPSRCPPTSWVMSTNHTS